MVSRLVLSTLVFSITATAADWPQFLGPERDGHAAEEITKLAPEPEVLWSRPLGIGYAGPAVVDDRVYVFHTKGNDALLEVLSVKDGALSWEVSYPSGYQDLYGAENGPRATPTITPDGKVFIYGAEGMLHCLDSKKGGDFVWKLDTRKDYASDKGFFGRASSPLFHKKSGTLIVQTGGKKAGILGLDAATGKEKWRATTHEAGYASPVLTSIDKQDWAIHFTRDGFVALDPAKGKVAIEKPHRASMHASVNAATPIMLDDATVFLSSCYGVGAALWKIDPTKRKVTPVWAGEDKLDCHYATPVLVGDHLYGFHGRQERGAEFRCVVAKTGKVKWTSGRLGSGSVLTDGKSLFILTEKGELIIHPASPAKWAPISRTQILGAGISAVPAIADGKLFARDQKRFVCVGLTAE